MAIDDPKQPLVPTPGEVAAEFSDGDIVPVPVEMLRQWQERLYGAFDLGFKVAGGTMIPDGARDMVELTLDRPTIESLAFLAEIAVENRVLRVIHDPEALQRFLETVSIHRSKP